MLPPSANTKGCAKSHPRWRRAVLRLPLGQDDVRFELGGSKVRLADDTPGMCRARTALLRVVRLSGAILIGGPSGEFLPGAYLIPGRKPAWNAAADHGSPGCANTHSSTGSRPTRKSGQLRSIS